MVNPGTRKANAATPVTGRRCSLRAITSNGIAAQGKAKI